MKPLDDTILDYFKVKSCQSVRHLHHNGTMYAVFITNRFRKIGWLTEIGGRYYGSFSKMTLKDKDDIIDYYLTMDANAKASIDALHGTGTENSATFQSEDAGKDTGTA